MFASEVYTSRRLTLLAKMAEKGAKGLAIFLGNVESPMNYWDNCYKFRQDSNFLYFWGIDEPLFAATLDLESGEECIYGNDVDIDDIIWMGPQDSVAVKAASVGVANSRPYSDFAKAVAAARAKGREIHFLPAARHYTQMTLASILGLAPEEVVTAGKKGCAKASDALVRSVIGMRLVRDSLEIAEIDKACDLGYEMHTVARQGVKVGTVEQEIVGRMEGTTMCKGWGPSFATILTQHGEIFHCHSHEAVIEPGKLLVIDAGAESNVHYASDFTRTYPTAGKYTSQQRDIYQIVYECNELAFEFVRPGVRYRDVHLAVARHMLDSLSQLGLVKGDLDTMLAEGIAGLFMPHGLGHNMGMDVHDMEDLGENLVGYDDDQTRSPQLGLGSLRMARTLVPGNVLTDEPGIYFIPDLIESWKKDGVDKGMVNYEKLKEYYTFGGIRLEDDVLVTEDGARRLGSKRLPIAPDEVEAAMAAE
ncbi:MAG: aminopeptidase P N-terminal domain-containing protein [Bacteroidales bacterium]|nr:aminopeptidase P N-terminal domain-containing protein [Candidatus Cryptobacteroides caccocaballi]